MVPVAICGCSLTTVECRHSIGKQKIGLLYGLHVHLELGKL